jgi:hypothetical protein
MFASSNENALVGCKDLDATVTSPEIGLRAGVALLSMVFCSTIAITIFYNEKLRQHPSGLIGYIFVCEALSCFNALVWAIKPFNFICYFGLHYLYQYTT